MRWLALWAMAASLGPQAALAHTPPATLGVVGVDDGEPFALRLAHGLALRDAQGSWRFLCPTRWGGPALALAAAAGPDDLWVIGEQGPVHIDRTGASVPLAAPALSPRTVRRLIAMPGSVVALAVEPGSQGGRASLWRLAQGTVERIGDAPEGAAAIATDGQQTFLGRTSSTAIIVETWGGAMSTRQVFAVAELGGRTLALEYAGGALWARLTDGQEARLLRLENGRASLALQTSGVLLGPVDQGGRALVAVDQALHLYGPSSDPLSSPEVSTSTAITCLDSSGGTAFGCARTRLLALGAVLEERFTMAELYGPELADLERDAALSCQLEWLDLATEAGLDPKAVPPVVAAEPSATPTPAGCSCLALAAPRRASGGLALLTLAVLARRGRQRPGPGIEAAGDSGRGRQPPPL